jgi:hypothetical protein
LYGKQNFYINNELPNKTWKHLILWMLY